MLICSIKNDPNTMVLVGFTQHGSKNVINLSDLGPIISQKLAEIKILSSEKKSVGKFLSIYNFLRFFSNVSR